MQYTGLLSKHVSLKVKRHHTLFEPLSGEFNNLGIAPSENSD